MSFVALVDRYAREAGLSDVRELAGALGIEAHELAARLMGVALATPHHLQALADALGLDAVEIFEAWKLAGDPNIRN